MSFAYHYIKDHKLSTEKDYAYQARTKKCRRKDSGERYTITNYKTL